MALKIDLKKFLALAAVMSQGMNTACTIIDNTTGDEASNSDPTNTPASTTAVDPTSGGETDGTAGETGETGETEAAGSDGTTVEAPTSTATEATSDTTDATSGTTGGGFVCSNGDPIDPMFVCDENFDCADNSDEVSGCGEAAFTCTLTKQEVPASWACDEFPDCTDASDEITGCMIEAFVCADGLFEIPAVFKCDMTPDCEDGSDEAMCP